MVLVLWWLLLLLSFGFTLWSFLQQLASILEIHVVLKVSWSVGDCFSSGSSVDRGGLFK